MSINYNRSSNNIKEGRKGGREEVEEKEAGRKINAIIRTK